MALTSNGCAPARIAHTSHRTHTLAQMLLHASDMAHALMRSCALTDGCAHARSRSRVHARGLMRPSSCACARARAYARVHTRACLRARSYARVLMRACSCARVHYVALNPHRYRIRFARTSHSTHTRTHVRTLVHGTWHSHSCTLALARALHALTSHPHSPDLHLNQHNFIVFYITNTYV